MKNIGFSIVVLFLGGCASIDFDSGDEGIVYYEPVPHLFYTVTDKCVSTVTLVSIPGKQKRIAFKTGYGSSVLSAEFSNGIITKVGQTSDSKIPGTLTSIAGLATAGILAQGQSPVCKPTAALYKIVDGVPDTDHPINFEISQNNPPQTGPATQ